MNFLKKKLKPLTSGFNQSSSSTTTPTATNARNQHKKDLEDDLYDEYVVEAPPHPSELIALGVDPSEIDINDPDKLRELYRKAKEEGKDKKFNSVLLARQRQKEEIEEKKRTREEWKFFDSLTSRVEQVVKESQKNLSLWKESSTVTELTEPDYELRQTPDEVFKSVTAAKLEKGANDWIDFDEDSGGKEKNKQQKSTTEQTQEDNKTSTKEFDEFGCPKRRASSTFNETQNIVVKEILEDFGIDLRTAEQRKALEKKQKEEEGKQKQLLAASQAALTRPESPIAVSKTDTAKKIVARPRPRPKGAAKDDETNKTDNNSAEAKELDPFDTSFVAPEVVAVPEDPFASETSASETPSKPQEQTKYVDPFDTSYVNL